MICPHMAHIVRERKTRERGNFQADRLVIKSNSLFISIRSIIVLNYVKIKPIDIQISHNNYYARFYRSDNDKMITKEVNNYRVVTFLA